MTAREKDLQRRALDASARKAAYHDKHSKLDRAKVKPTALNMLILDHGFGKGTRMSLKLSNRSDLLFFWVRPNSFDISSTSVLIKVRL